MTAWDAGLRPPDSFWWAVPGLSLISGAIPMCTGMALMPLSPWGVNAFATGLFVAMGFGMALALPLGLGLRWQRAWWRRWVLWTGSALLAGWLITIAFVLAYPLGLISPYPGANAGFAVVDWVALAILLALALPAWWLLRTLLDPYWRSGSA